MPSKALTPRVNAFGHLTRDELSNRLIAATDALCELQLEANELLELRRHDAAASAELADAHQILDKLGAPNDVGWSAGQRIRWFASVCVDLIQKKGD